MSLPALHPAIVVSYDADTIWLWFVLIPLQMHLAFFAGPPRVPLGRTIIAAISIAAVSVFILPGIDRAAIVFVSTQAFAFLLTLALFRTRTVGRYTGIAEIVLLALLLVRMLGFARASETFAEASSSLTQAILAISFGAVLLHALVVYLLNFGEGIRKRTLREVGMFATAAVILGVIVALVLPPDFVNHNVVLNELRDPPEPELLPLDGTTDGLDGGNLRSDRPSDEEGNGSSQGNQSGDGEGEGQEEAQPRLEGIPAGEWQNRRGQGQGDSQAEGEGNSNQDGEGEGENKQYAVMVVGSKHDPIYAADGYFSTFDPVEGFTYLRDEPLNRLTYTRLIETWRNPTPALDPERAETDIVFLSTISERVVPYDPLEIQPTVLNTKYHPFDFAYSATSNISQSAPPEWRKITPLTAAEREEFAEFLRADMSEEHREGIQALADNLFENRDGYYQRLDAILGHFSTYQYEIGFTDDVSLGAVSNFLFNTKNGDCTEFSNSTALLARIAGIPSRVVTGYLATDGLQTDQHRQGIEVLKQSIEPLNDYPSDELYLVTSAHRHSWVQVHMPGYGWVDIETTSTAIPPAGSANPNGMDIVIPIITPEEIIQRNFEFPWLLIGQVVLILGVTALGTAYLFRAGRQLYLKSVSGGNSRRALQAHYTLLLSHMAREGYPIKPVSDTSIEYAERHPEIRPFADHYTRMRYRTTSDPTEREESWKDLRSEYRHGKGRTRRTGLVSLVKRIVSLRELRY